MLENQLTSLVIPHKIPRQPIDVDGPDRDDKTTSAELPTSDLNLPTRPITSSVSS